MSTSDEGWVVVFHSPRVKPCRERALVLATQDIPHAIGQEAGQHVLVVPQALAEIAARELTLYEKENVGWPPRFELPPPAPGTKWSWGLYGGLLILFFAFQRDDAFGLDWVRTGAAHAEAIRDGSWWRTVTALTLHGDLVHLLSNVVYGSLFGFLVAYVLGGGLGWLVILAAGVLGNLTNAWLQDPTHLSIGASTSVFGAVGAMAGAEWRRRRIFKERRLRRAAPLVIAFLLLSEMGMNPGNNEGIDVLAHFTGLVWGLPLGYAASTHDQSFLQNRSVQGALGVLTLVLIGVAWFVAARTG